MQSTFTDHDFQYQHAHVARRHPILKAILKASEHTESLHMPILKAIGAAERMGAGLQDYYIYRMLHVLKAIGGRY